MKIFSQKQMGIVVSSQQESNIFWHLSDLPECNLCLNIQLTVALATWEGMSLVSFLFFPIHWILKSWLLPWHAEKVVFFAHYFEICALYCHRIFPQCLEISRNNGTDKYLFIHTLLSPAVRLRWKLRESDKSERISRKEATNEQSGRSNFFSSA